MTSETSTETKENRTLKKVSSADKYTQTKETNFENLKSQDNKPNNKFGQLIEHFSTFTDSEKSKKKDILNTNEISTDKAKKESSSLEKSSKTIDKTIKSEETKLKRKRSLDNELKQTDKKDVTMNTLENSNDTNKNKDKKIKKKSEESSSLEKENQIIDKKIKSLEAKLKRQKISDDKLKEEHEQNIDKTKTMIALDNTKDKNKKKDKKIRKKSDDSDASKAKENKRYSDILPAIDNNTNNNNVKEKSNVPIDEKESSLKTKQNSESKKSKSLNFSNLKAKIKSKPKKNKDDKSEIGGIAEKESDNRVTTPEITDNTIIPDSILNIGEDVDNNTNFYIKDTFKLKKDKKNKQYIKKNMENESSLLDMLQNSKISSSNNDEKKPIELRQLKTNNMELKKIQKTKERSKSAICPEENSLISQKKANKRNKEKAELENVEENSSSLKMRKSFKKDLLSSIDLKRSKGPFKKKSVNSKTSIYSHKAKYIKFKPLDDLYSTVTNETVSELKIKLRNYKNVQTKYIIQELKLTPLHVAAKKHNYGVCKYLINQGANVNAKTISHNTPLHYAAEISDGEICRLLVKSGAMTDIRNKKNEIPADLVRNSEDLKTALTPYMIFNRTCDVKQAKALADSKDIIKCATKILGNRKPTPEMFEIEKIGYLPNIAASNRMISAVKYFITNLKIDPNYLDSNGYSLLHCAIAATDNNIALFLLENGANQYLATKSGQKLLNLMLIKDRDDYFEFLKKTHKTPQFMLNKISTSFKSMDEEEKYNLRYLSPFKYYVKWKAESEAIFY